MKTLLCFLSLFAATTSLQSEEFFSVESTTNPVKSYLAFCHAQNSPLKPVYFHGSFKEKRAPFSDLVILSLNFSMTMPIEEFAERVLYADSDVVHIANISTEAVSDLYSKLNTTYSHFIHMPHLKSGVVLASKHPIAQAEVMQIERENNFNQDSLDFVLEGSRACHFRVSLGNSSIEMVNAADLDSHIISPTLLVDLPAAFIVVKQSTFPFFNEDFLKLSPLSSEGFQILPVKHGGGENRSGEGGYRAEARAGVSWGDGNTHWEAGAQVEVYDGRGNYAEVEVQQNDSGKGSVDVRAGHEE